MRGSFRPRVLRFFRLFKIGRRRAFGPIEPLLRPTATTQPVEPVKVKPNSAALRRGPLTPAELADRRRKVRVINSLELRSGNPRNGLRLIHDAVPDKKLSRRVNQSVEVFAEGLNIRITCIYAGKLQTDLQREIFGKKVFLFRAKVLD